MSTQTTTIVLPDNPEFSATQRAIAREQYRDDAFPFTPPAGQLWERVAELEPDSDEFRGLRNDAWFRSRVNGNEPARLSGRPYAKARFGGRAVSGVIRAGERVK